MLTEVTQAGDAVCYRPTQPAAPPQAFAPIRELLDGAKKPMILAGGPGWSDRACAQLQDFAEANGIPVATSFRGRILSTTGRHASPAISARPGRPLWCSASRKPTCCS